MINKNSTFEDERCDYCRGWKSWGCHNENGVPFDVDDDRDVEAK